MSCVVIGYTFNADNHCNSCTKKIYKDDGYGHYYGVDDEGNQIHPIFGTDEILETMNCGACGDYIYEVVHVETDSEYAKRVAKINMEGI